jgi:kumamolisin
MEKGKRSVSMQAKKTIGLAKSHRKPAPGTRLIGEVNPQESIEITVRLRSRTSEDRIALLEEILQQPPAERHYLSRAELASRFGADAADIEKVTAFARENNLTVVNASIPRRSVVLSGTVAELIKAFPTELRRYDSELGEYRGRIGALQIPQSLSGVIEAIFGFDNRRQARAHSILRMAKSRPTRAGSPDVSFSPAQLAGIYDFPNGDGAGQCIGIIEFGGGYDTEDLKTYFANYGLNPPATTSVSVDGVGNNPNSSNPDDNDADGEVMLDLEVAATVAPKAKIVVYFAPFTEQGWVDVLTTAVQDSVNKPSVLSISWGWPESNDLWTQQAMDAVNQTLLEASLAGVTVCVAAGDDGSEDELTDGHAHVDFPSVSPYVMACGGTTLTVSSDKTSIAGEVVWNNGPRSQGGGATGGGVSELTPLPVWQANCGVPPSINTGFIGRGVPDVAADADPDTGYKIRVHGQDGVAGGTSAVAPLYAALVARLNQSLGTSVGFMNPKLYTEAASATFHDITQGNNDVSNLGAYSAKPGWDACTGLGTPDGNRILTALQTPATAFNAVDTQTTRPTAIPAVHN